MHQFNIQKLKYKFGRYTKQTGKHRKRQRRRNGIGKKRVDPEMLGVSLVFKKSECWELLQTLNTLQIQER